MGVNFSVKMFRRQNYCKREDGSGRGRRVGGGRAGRGEGVFKGTVTQKSKVCKSGCVDEWMTWQTM